MLRLDGLGQLEGCGSRGTNPDYVEEACDECEQLSWDGEPDMMGVEEISLDKPCLSQVAPSAGLGLRWLPCLDWVFFSTRGCGWLQKVCAVDGSKSLCCCARRTATGRKRNAPWMEWGLAQLHLFQTDACSALWWSIVLFFSLGPMAKSSGDVAPALKHRGGLLPNGTAHRVHRLHAGMHALLHPSRPRTA